ncbi:adenosine deaminase [Nocardioides sp. DS6]|uniref:Adenine deaminase n=1 Tax=Nocardioides eburneus TaxID=3231482 RepID=A0ABV3SYQ7_9ACTN
MPVLETPPTVELHLHIEGTLEPELIVALAERNGVTLPYAGVEELRARYDFTDLQSFLDLYYDNMAVLRTAADFTLLAETYLRRAAAGGVRHAEIFFDPQAHLVRGVALAEVVTGLAEGLRRGEDAGITSTLIACFLRDRPAEEACEVLEQLVALDAPIVGIGLDSTEVGNPPAKFVDVFARAKELGLHRVAHAGEEGGPECVAEALDLLGAERIDHGVRALQDPALMARLVAERVPLTVCPLSNVRLKGVETLADHPLPALLDTGALVTINSDDPAYFGGYADDNLLAVADTFGLSDHQLADLARNAVVASFLPADRRRALLAEVDDWLATRCPDR